MKMSNLVLAATVAGAIAAPLTVLAQSGPAAKPDYKFEKCYGVVKAGANDCQTATSSCAGTARRDAQADAWVYLPAGSCGKIVGGSLEPGKA